MIYKIRQVVTHPDERKALEKVSHIIGTDLRHAVSSLRCSESMKRELLKKSKTQVTDFHGRTLTIEIIQEVKA